MSHDRHHAAAPADDRAPGHTLFDTAIGCCAMAWGASGVVAVQLPEASAAATRQRLLRRLAQPAPATPPPAPIAQAIAGVQALLSGAPRDLREIALDMSHIAPFQQQVYALTRAIAPGSTRSYGELAQQIGDKRLSRAVGQALGLNPFAPIVPCHRVLAANGKTGGFSAHGGAQTKLRMLQIEGYRPGATASLFDGL